MNSWDSYVGTSQQTGTLTWNSNGSMQQMQINDALNTPNTQTCGYVHDDLLRLSGVGCQSGWGQNFSYDAYGNITKTVTGNIGTAFNLGYDSGNHVHTFGYDGDGNVTNDTFNTYSYDAEGRPVSVGSITGSYDAFNRLVEVHASGATTQILYAPDGYKFAYMNGQSVKWYMAPLAGGLQAVYTSGTPNPPAYWLHSDWLGSARLASTTAQTLYGDQSYAPFGETYDTKNATLNVFTGQMQDLNSISNVYDFLYRQYSSTQGRWMVPDPAGAAAVDITNPQTWNRYAYVANNPLNATDPLGLYKLNCNDPQNNCGPYAPQPDFSGFDSLFCGGECGFDWFYPDWVNVDFVDPSRQAVPPTRPALTRNSDTCPLWVPGGDYTLGQNANPWFTENMSTTLNTAFTDLNQQGITPMITSGFRTAADQARMQQGGSGPNPAASVSWHQVGQAVDFNTRDGNFSSIVDEMTSQGLTWGGTFHRQDPPDFQLPAASQRPSSTMVQNCGRQP